MGLCGETGLPTFTKGHRIARCRYLCTSEKPGEIIARETSHNKHPIHGVNTCRHKSRMSVNVFKVILFSSVPG